MKIKLEWKKVIKDLTECKRCSELEIVDSSRGDEVPSSKGGKTIRKPLLFHFQFSDCRHPPPLPFPVELVTAHVRRNWGAEGQLPFHILVQTEGTPLYI